MTKFCCAWHWNHHNDCHWLLLSFSKILQTTTSHCACQQSTQTPWNFSPSRVNGRSHERRLRSSPNPFWSVLGPTWVSIERQRMHEQLQTSATQTPGLPQQYGPNRPFVRNTHWASKASHTHFLQRIGNWHRLGSLSLASTIARPLDLSVIDYGRMSYLVWSHWQMMVTIRIKGLRWSESVNGHWFWNYPWIDWLNRTKSLQNCMWHCVKWQWGITKKPMCECPTAAKIQSSNTHEFHSTSVAQREPWSEQQTCPMPHGAAQRQRCWHHKNGSLIHTSSMWHTNVMTIAACLNLLSNIAKGQLKFFLGCIAHHCDLKDSLRIDVQKKVHGALLHLGRWSPLMNPQSQISTQQSTCAAEHQQKVTH